MKYAIFALICCGSLYGSQWYYTNKYEPVVSELQAQVDSDKKIQKENQSISENNARDIKTLKDQLDSSTKTYEIKLGNLTKVNQELISKLEASQKELTSYKAPVVNQQQVIVDQSPAQQTMIGADGSIVMVPAKNSSNQINSNVAKIQAIQSTLQSLQTQLQNTIRSNNEWHGRGNIPDNISSEAITHLQQDIQSTQFELDALMAK